MKRLLPILAALAFAAIVIGSHAAGPTPAAAVPTSRPGLPSGVTACETCHGPRGEGNASEDAPRLAAQSRAYLVRQLAAFADGSRSSKVMAPIAKGLDEKLRNALAAYYASLEAPPTQAARPPAGGGERGRRLATRGDESRGIQACGNCHGPGGIGEPPTSPYLAGQHGVYLAAALRAWRDGSRRTDPSGQMPAIARRLSDEDIAALADYYAAAPAPGPGAFRMARGPARAPAAGPAGQAGPPAKPGGEAQGVGTEQGAPTTGGAQGPGGGGGATEEKSR